MTTQRDMMARQIIRDHSRKLGQNEDISPTSIGKARGANQQHSDGQSASYAGASILIVKLMVFRMNKNTRNRRSGNSNDLWPEIERVYARPCTLRTGSNRPPVCGALLPARVSSSVGQCGYRSLTSYDKTSYPAVSSADSCRCGGGVDGTDRVR